MNFQPFVFLITGLTDLLTHSPKGTMTAGPQGPKKKIIPTPEDEAKKGLYLNEGGQYCFPSVAFRTAILLSSKGKKVGKTRAETIYGAGINLNDVDELVPLLDGKTRKPTKKYDIDLRRVVIQRQGIMRARPRFKNWGCDVTLHIDTEALVPKLVLEELNEAGRIVGVGDFRVDKKGTFGKFKAELA